MDAVNASWAAAAQVYEGVVAGFALLALCFMILWLTVKIMEDQDTDEEDD